MSDFTAGDRDGGGWVKLLAKWENDVRISVGASHRDRDLRGSSGGTGGGESGYCVQDSEDKGGTRYSG